MPQNEEENDYNENETSINTISELPGRPFKITMEFPLFFLMLGLSLSSTAINNIILYRTCVHSLHYSVDECEPFLLPEKDNRTKGLEEEVQKYVTFITMVRMVVESLIPAVLSLFLGVWSDTHGRKPLVVWPLFGMVVTSMLTVIYSLLDDYGPWWFILAVIPFSMTGGFTVLITGAFCYVSDITTTDKRSLRMTLLEAGFAIGSVIGGIMSSYLLKEIGNVYLLLLVTGLYVFAYSFTNIYLTESLTGALKGGLCTVLDFLLVKEMVRECFKRRPNYGRAQIILLTLANSLSIFIMYGMSNLEYMYTREKLHWAMKDYTIFSASSTMISFVGSLIGVTLIQKVLRLSDLNLAIVAFLSSVADSLIRAFAVTKWHMYFGASVSLLKILSGPLIRSFLTKILPIQDIAKVFALLCAMEAMAPLMSPLIYSSLYKYTLSYFPGAVYILSACINGVCIIFLGFVQYYRWNTTTYQPL